jgi:hypothetical protein
LVLPVDYAADGSDVIIRVGDQLVRHLDGVLVAFQADNASYEQATDGRGTEGTWSVLVRGLVTGRPEPSIGVDLPHPRVAEPGHRLVRIRGDVITGRRLRRSGEADPAV